MQLRQGAVQFITKLTDRLAARSLVLDVLRLAFPVAGNARLQFLDSRHPVPGIALAGLLLALYRSRQSADLTIAVL